MWNEVRNPVVFGKNIPYILMAEFSPIYSYERSMIDIHTAENGGMGIAIGCFGITLQRSEVDR